MADTRLAILVAWGNNNLSARLSWLVLALLLSSATSVSAAPPTANPDSVVTNEDTALPITLSGADGDGDNLTFAVVTPPVNGVLNGTPPNLTYSPNADFNGPDSFTFVANDGLDDSAPATIDINILAVNDPPSFSGGPIQVKLEDAAPVNVPGWATAISSGPPNESAQVVTFTITANDNASLFSVGPTVSVTGNLSYSLAANANGVANISVTAFDNGGTANGGDDSSAAYLFTITVTAVNDEPSLLLAGNQPINEDAGAQTVPGFATAGAGGGSDESGQTFSYTVGNDYNALFASQPAINGSGQLSYTPADNANGSALVTVAVTDNGGTLNGGDNTSGNATFTITVAAVNDPPAFSAGGNQTVSEDTPAVTVAAWASGISAGPANESAQTVSFVVTGNDNSALFAVAPAVSSNGNLTYTLAANANGTSNISLMALDNGGTANGGGNSSNEQFFSITVTPVNDAPSFTAGANQTVNEDAAPVTVPGWASNISTGAPNESAQTLSFTFTANSQPALFSSGPSINAAGALSFTLASNANGVANLTVRLTDNGGTANGGQDTSAAASFSITVTAVNDAPAAQEQSLSTNEDTPKAITLTGTDAENSPLTYSIVAQPLHGSVTGGTGPGRTYTPDLNYHGEDSFSYRVNDGNLNSIARFVTINVLPVNDVPAAAPKSATTDEDTEVVITLSGTDVEGSALTFQAATQPTHGSVSVVGNQATYTPAAFYNGADSFTYVANDGSAASAPALVSITINSINDPPYPEDDNLTVQKGGTKTVLNGGATSLLANDIEVEGNPMLVTTTPVSPPQHGSVTLFSNGTFSYTHDNSLNLGDSFVYQVCDNQVPTLCSTATVHVFVDLGSAGVCTQPNAQIPDNEPVTGLASTIDFGSTGDLASVAVQVQITHSWVGDLTLTLEHDGTTVTLMERPGRPTIAAGCDGNNVDALFEDGADQTANELCLASNAVPDIAGNARPVESLSAFQGADSDGPWTLRATDSVQVDVGTLVKWCLVAIVNPAGNLPPVANPQAVAATEDTAKAITLTGSDPNGNPLTFQIVDVPAHGSLTGTPPNVTYTPHANYAGSDSFTFTTRDGYLTSALATVSITVAGVNDGPNATNDALTVAKGGAATLLTGGANSLLANDSDPEGNSLVMNTTPVTSPANGSVVLNSNGTFTYTHNGTFTTRDSFTYRVCDTGSPSACNNATVSVWVDLSVDPKCSAPLVPIPDGNITTGVSNVITLAGSGGISDLNVLVDLTHTQVADLVVVLHSDDGTSVTLLDRPGTSDPELVTGCTGDNVDVVFDDAAGTPAESVCNATPPAISGTRKPFQLLSNFNGDGLAGDWTLQVFDASPFSSGAFRQWCLFPTTATNTAPYANLQTVLATEETPVGITLTGGDVDGNPITFTVLSQPSHGVLTGTAPNLTYTPASNYFGTDSFTFRTRDGSLNSSTATVTIQVANTQDPPTASPQSVSTNEDVAKAITLTGVDIDGDALSYSVTSPPGHGSLTGTAPNITYTPFTNYNGSDSFAFVANDGQQASAPALVSITINPVNDAPFALPASLTTVEDTPLIVTFFAGDAEGQPLTYTVTSGPSHGTLSGSGSSRTYTPAPDYLGPDSFVYKVNDGALDSNLATVSITVTAVNDAPVAADDALTVQRGQSASLLNGGIASLTANDSDPESQVLSVSATPLTPPEHGTVVLNSNGTFSYIHDNSISVLDAFEYEVCDAGTPAECASAWVSVYIDLSNSPECSAPLVSIPDNDPAGASDTIVIADSHTIADVDVFLRVSHDFVGHLSVIVSHGGSDVVLLDRPGYVASGSGCSGMDIEARFSDEAGSPAEDACAPVPPAIAGNLVPIGNLGDFDGGDTSGAWTLTVLDEAAGAAGIFEQWCVLPSFSPNTAPAANPQSVSTNEDVAKLITLTASDGDGDSLTFAIATPPAHGSLSGSPPNVVYTPQLNYFGADSFSFTANDGSLDSAPATVNITVSAVNDPPVANAQSLTTAEDTAKPITLTGSDVEGSPLSFTVLAQPAHGVLGGSGAAVTYTPAANYNGADSFTFKVNDGSLDSTPATVNITVTPGQDAPVANAQAVTTNEDTAKSITLTGSDPDGDPLTFQIVGQPSKGSLTGTAPNVTYTPNLNANGSDSFTFRVNDGGQNSPNATVSITVSPVNDTPVAIDESMTALKGLATTTLDGGGSSLLANDSDLDGDTLSVKPTPLVAPLHGTITLNSNGSFSYLHNNSLNTADSFAYEVCDNGTPVKCDAAMVSIYVDLSVDPYCSAPLLAITDGDAVTGVSDTLSVATSGAVEDFNLFLLASHTRVGDLVVTLEHNGETITLLDRPGAPALGANGCTGDDIDALFDDEAATPAETKCAGVPPAIAGTAAPTELLSTFDLLNIVGDWTLKVTDASSGETGVFEQWCLVPAVSGNSPPVANNQSLSINEDIATGITLSATDVDAQSLTFQVIAPPAHGSLSGAAPNLIYTPGLNYFGTDSFTFRANDGTLNSNTATVSITINPVNDNPAASPQSLATSEDTPLGITLTGSDAEGSALSFLLQSSPSHGQLTGTAPNLTYTPTLNFNGVDSFTFKVNDGALDSAAATVSITVNPINDAPVANAQSKSTSEDTPVAVTLTGSDADGNPLSYFIAVQPAHGALSGTPPNLTYTPALNYHGADSFTFRVFDGAVYSATAIVNLTVNPVNDVPVANAQAVSTNEDTPLVITLTGSDADGSPLTYATVAQPAHGALTGTPPNLTYTPALNYNGADSFTFRVNDGTVNSTNATIAITVNAVNDVPVANAQSLSTNEDIPLAVTLTGSDADSNPLTFAIVAQPIHGTLSGSPPNLTYTPALNYNGADSFTFRVNDGTVNSANATIAITVNAINDVPVANAQSLSTNEDTPLPITLTGSDADGNPLSYAIVAQPTHGGLTGTPPNLTYTPALNYNGADNFTFRVNDGTVNSTTATVSITVNAINDVPVANAQSLPTNEDVALPITLTGFDADSDALTFGIVSLPAHGVISGTAPNITYTPQANYHGTDSFTFRVNDGKVNSANATISLTITAVNDVPVANAQSLSTNEDTPLPVTLTGTDADGDPLTFAIVAQPAHGTLTGTPPNVTYTPTLNYTGADSFTFRVNDGTVNSSNATIAITVNAVNDVPVANSQSVSVDEDVAKAIVLSGSDGDGSPLTYIVLTQPAHGSLSGTPPNLNFAPQANYSGADSFTFKVNDGIVDSASATVSITINPVNDAPVAQGDGITALKGMQTTTLDGGATSLLANDSDVEGQTLSVKPVPVVAPQHGSVTLNANGTFSYLHDNTLSAHDRFDYEVCDSGTPSQCDVATVEIYVDLSVDPFCRAPVLDIPDASGSAADTLNVSTLGALTDVNVYLLTSHPRVGDLAVTLAHDGTTVKLLDRPGFPTLGTNGCEHADVEALFDDEGGSSAENTCAVTPPTIGSIVIPAESLAQFDGKAGNGSWTLTVTDLKSGQVGVFEQWCLVPTIAGNTAPVANAQSLSTAEDMPLNIALTGSDIDGDALTFGIVTPPAHGGLSGSPPNLVYTPHPNFNGSDSFTFRANDGSLNSAPAVIGITVNAVNDVPVANAQSLSTNEDTPLPITLTGSDADGNPLTFAIVTQPAHGTLTGTPPNVTYTPALNYSGADSFTFRVNDGSVNSVNATISIAVNLDNDVPIANSQSVATNEDSALAVTLTGSDGDGDPLSYSIVAQPAHGGLTGTPPNLTYTPALNYHGPDSFTFKVNDGLADSAGAAVNITVHPVNDNPQAGNDFMALEKGETATTLSGGAASLLANDSDVEGDSLQVTTTPVSGPQFGSLSLSANGTFSYTHDDSLNGQDQFVYEVCDNGAPAKCDTAVVSITIDVGEKPEVIMSDGFESQP